MLIRSYKMAAESSAPQPPSSATLPLLDRVAIVTGASRGIGRSIALHLSTLGARLVINYATNPAKAESLAAQINSSPPHPTLTSPRAVTARCDVTDPAQVQSLFDAAERAFAARPHILVTSAGVHDPTHSHIADTPEPEFDRIMAVNAGGTFLCLREAGRRLVRGGGGRIVTVSSSLAAIWKPGHGAYTASKAAVEALTKVMAKEMKGTGITVNCVAPGPVATEMFFAGRTEEEVRRIVEPTPLGRVGETDDISPVVGFLVSDSGEWINGQIIQVNGGIV